MAGGLAAARAAGFLAAAVVLVDRGPGAALGLFLRYALVFVAFGNVVRLTLLLVGVFGFVAAGHGNLLPSLNTPGRRAVWRRFPPAGQTRDQAAGFQPLALHHR